MSTCTESVYIYGFFNLTLQSNFLPQFFSYVASLAASDKQNIHPCFLVCVLPIYNCLSGLQQYAFFSLGCHGCRVSFLGLNFLFSISFHPSHITVLCLLVHTLHFIALSQTFAICPSFKHMKHLFDAIKISLLL